MMSCRRFPIRLGFILAVWAWICFPRLEASATASPLILDDVRRYEPTIRVKLKYNSPDNAFKRRFYRNETAVLRPAVARRLARAQGILRKQGFGLLVWDAYRAPSVQYALYRAKPGSRYLSNPRKGSKHSRAAAVDVTLVGPDGRPATMPTPHDEFSPRARPGAVRGVSQAARRNSRILAQAMRSAGFIQNAYEWWHFSDPNANRYSLIFLPPQRVLIRGPQVREQTASRL